MLHEKNVTSRMKQAFPFLRILAVMPQIDASSLPITMEQLLQLFPRLEIIYISPPGSHAMHHPHTPLRRIGLQGPDELCLWAVTHLDLVLMSPEQWPDLVHLGLPRFHTLTHMCCDLETPSEIGEVWRHLQVLVPALPPSLLLCLVNIHFQDVEVGELRDRYDIGLDDRILLCNHEDCSGEKGGQWVLTADLLNDFEEWNGAVIERKTYWSRGLDMVNLRRAENS
ncbi:hypothetical protein DL96DRAFT_1590564 [Flagelloscypha sp. PMI_526]|nr:hypothetical protein DL96DRAFT_1590564 [Flagelloscypha sp. PMI_526]